MTKAVREWKGWAVTCGGQIAFANSHKIHCIKFRLGKMDGKLKVIPVTIREEKM